MSFKRSITPKTFASGEKLSSDLAGIGFRISARRSINANIEDTLVAASLEGLGGDYRTLGILVMWIETHIKWVNADRLVKIITALNSNEVSSFWCAIAQWKSKDHRFKRLIKLDLPQKTMGSEFQFQKYGEDRRFVGTHLRVPANLLRERKSDVLSPKELASIHLPYRYRVMMGPSYSADMWAELETNSQINASDLARRTYGSFASAWNVISAKKIVA